MVGTDTTTAATSTAEPMDAYRVATLRRPARWMPDLSMVSGGSSASAVASTVRA
ncbi:hypothetical protein ACRAKI_35060 [Saccharothrix isguenensis]